MNARDFDFGFFSLNDKPNKKFPSDLSMAYQQTDPRSVGRAAQSAENPPLPTKERYRRVTVNSGNAQRDLQDAITSARHPSAVSPRIVVTEPQVQAQEQVVTGGEGRTFEEIYPEETQPVSNRVKLFEKIKESRNNRLFAVAEPVSMQQPEEANNNNRSFMVGEPVNMRVTQPVNMTESEGASNSSSIVVGQPVSMLVAADESPVFDKQFVTGRPMNFTISAESGTHQQNGNYHKYEEFKQRDLPPPPPPHQGTVIEKEFVEGQPIHFHVHSSGLQSESAPEIHQHSSGQQQQKQTARRHMHINLQHRQQQESQQVQNHHQNLQQHHHHQQQHQYQQHQHQYHQQQHQQQHNHQQQPTRRLVKAQHFLTPQPVRRQHVESFSYNDSSGEEVDSVVQMRRRQDQLKRDHRHRHVYDVSSASESDFKTRQVPVHVTQQTTTEGTAANTNLPVDIRITNQLRRTDQYRVLISPTPEHLQQQEIVSQQEAFVQQQGGFSQTLDRYKPQGHSTPKRTHSARVAQSMQNIHMSEFERQEQRRMEEVQRTEIKRKNTLLKEQIKEQRMRQEKERQRREFEERQRREEQQREEDERRKQKGIIQQQEMEMLRLKNIDILRQLEAKRAEQQRLKIQAETFRRSKSNVESVTRSTMHLTRRNSDDRSNKYATDDERSGMPRHLHRSNTMRSSRSVNNTPLMKRRGSTQSVSGTGTLTRNGVKLGRSNSIAKTKTSAGKTEGMLKTDSGDSTEYETSVTSSQQTGQQHYMQQQKRQGQQFIQQKQQMSTQMENLQRYKMLKQQQQDSLEQQQKQQELMKQQQTLKEQQILKAKQEQQMLREQQLEQQRVKEQMLREKQEQQMLREQQLEQQRVKEQMLREKQEQQVLGEQLIIEEQRMREKQTLREQEMFRKKQQQIMQQQQIRQQHFEQQERGIQDVKRKQVWSNKENVTKSTTELQSYAKQTQYLRSQSTKQLSTSSTNNHQHELIRSHSASAIAQVHDSQQTDTGGKRFLSYRERKSHVPKSKQLKRQTETKTRGASNQFAEESSLGQHHRSVTHSSVNQGGCVTGQGSVTILAGSHVSRSKSSTVHQEERRQKITTTAQKQEVRDCVDSIKVVAKGGQITLSMDHDMSSGERETLAEYVYGADQSYRQITEDHYGSDTNYHHHRSGGYNRSDGYKSEGEHQYRRKQQVQQGTCDDMDLHDKQMVYYTVCTRYFYPEERDWIVSVHRMGKAKVPVVLEHQDCCVFWNRLYNQDREDIVVQKLAPPSNEHDYSEVITDRRLESDSDASIVPKKLLRRKKKSIKPWVC